MKQKLLSFFLFLLLLTSSLGLYSQSLQKGAIAFIGINRGSTQSFSFIALSDLPAGEKIYFTDEGWENDDTWGNLSLTDDDHSEWTIPSGLTTGTIITMQKVDGTWISNYGDFFAGGINLQTAGDQILAYQTNAGTRPTYIEYTNFIAGIHLNYDETNYNSETGWNNSVNSNTENSTVPFNLTNGKDAVSLFTNMPEYNNARYNGTLSGSAYEILASINNKENWEFNNEPFNLSSTGYSTEYITSPLEGSLSIGALAIIGVNSDTSADEISFVALDEIPAGETVFITDFGWDRDMSQLNQTIGDGVIKWDITKKIPKGTIFKVSISADNILSTGMSNYGNISVDPYNYWTQPAIEDEGESWIIFQGRDYTVPTVFIFGFGNWSSTISADGEWQVFRRPLSTTSYLPTGLTNGINAVANTGSYHSDNMVYKGINTGAKTEILRAISDYNNWTGSETEIQDINPNGTNFPASFFESICELSTSITDQTNVKCNGEATGSLTVTVSGGASDYTYKWSNDASTSGSSSTNTITELAAGTYSVTVTDSKGCTATTTATIEEPTELTAYAEVKTNVSCNGESDGSARASVTGGVAPYSYKWSTGATSADLGQEYYFPEYNCAGCVKAGTYSVTVTDANGCEATASVTITEPEALSVSAVVDSDVSRVGGSDGAATATPGGGTPGYTYLWSNGVEEASISGVPAGTYTVDVTDVNGCITSDSVTITEPTCELTATISQTNVKCNGEATGSLTVTVSGGTSDYTYKWSNDVSTSGSSSTINTITNLAAGSYSVTVTDSKGCTATASASIEEPTALVATSSHSDIFCNGDATGSIDLSVSGGTRPYVYSWNNNATTEDLSEIAAGTYTVDIIDANGCKTSLSTTVREAPALNISFEKTDNLCAEDNSGAIDLTVTGGISSYTFLWSNNSTTEDLSNLSNGDYTVTVTDALGCTATESVEIRGSEAYTVDTLENIISCGSYILPVLTNGDYYTQPNGEGDMLIAGDEVASSQSLFIYGENANGCSDEHRFDILIEENDIAEVTFNNETFVYDGTSHNIEVNNLPAGATVTYSNNDKKVAGTYVVTATITSGNTRCGSLELTANLIINKAEAVITTTSPQTFVYDATMKTIDASLNHEEAELIYSPQQGYTNAGTYEITVTAEETANYLAASEDVTLVIENAETEDVSFTDASFIYDGTPKRIEVAGLPEDASVSYENNGQTDAGTYTVTAIISRENYNELELTADLIINKAEAVITTTSPQTFVYDATMKTIDASLNHEEAELIYSPQQGYTNAGTYEITVTAEETANYLAASEDVTLVIENAETEGVSFSDASFIYDGTPKRIEVAGLPEDASVSYENNDQTDAGTYTVTAIISRENYNELELTADLIINKAEAVITTTSPQTFVYDATMKTIDASLNHEEAELIYSPQQGYTNAGTYEITVTAEETANYLAASMQVSLVIENDDLEGVVFEDASFEYDGTPKSIFISNLADDATVTYTGNGQTNAGNYTVSANVSRPNYNDATYRASLTITPADQEITFETLETRDIATDEDFQLNASSSSGLAIRYEYSSEDENPAATVSEDGAVNLIGEGNITITAYQEGNGNYQSAEPVSRVLTIINSEVVEFMDPVITVAGVPYQNPSETIYYLMDCGNGATEVSIDVEVASEMQVTPGRSFTVETPEPGIYSETIEVLNNGQTWKTYTIIVEKQFNFSDIVEQKFNNVLLVNNNPSTNGGYRFTEFRWFKDGQYIGSGQYYSAGNSSTDRLDPDGQYHVELLTEDGQELRTCIGGISAESTNQIMLAPSPVEAGAETEFYADFSPEELKGMKIIISNLNGKILTQLNTSKQITRIPIPSTAQQGVYMLTCETNKRVESIKFIIK